MEDMTFDELRNWITDNCTLSSVEEMQTIWHVYLHPDNIHKFEIQENPETGDKVIYFDKFVGTYGDCKTIYKIDNKNNRKGLEE